MKEHKHTHSNSLIPSNAEAITVHDGLGKGDISERKQKRQDRSSHPHDHNRQDRRLPVGDASCGLFGIADDFTEDRLSLDELLIQDREATFFFRAHGDSMAPFIEEGDILVADSSRTPHSGQVIIAYFEGTRLCKRLMYRGNQAYLCSDNPRYRPLSICEESEFQVFGVVIAIIRQTL